MVTDNPQVPSNILWWFVVSFRGRRVAMNELKMEILTKSFSCELFSHKYTYQICVIEKKTKRRRPFFTQAQTRMKITRNYLLHLVVENRSLK